jgi:Skp family chaperone for outer membrane proteins
MHLFLSDKRRFYNDHRTPITTYGLVVSIALVCLLSAGCKKRTPVTAVKAPLESVITNRMNDAAYVETLRQNRKEQADKALERSAITAQMQACGERVKATLPKGAGEDALKAALAKDEAWLKLDAQYVATTNEIERVLNDARQKIRQRMVEESRAVQSVAEGRAKAIDQTANNKK